MPRVFIPPQIQPFQSAFALAVLSTRAVGLLRGWTGGFESSAALIGVVAAAMGWSGWGAGRKMLVQEDGG